MLLLVSSLYSYKNVTFLTFTFICPTSVGRIDARSNRDYLGASGIWYHRVPSRRCPTVSRDWTWGIRWANIGRYVGADYYARSGDERLLHEVDNVIIATVLAEVYLCNSRMILMQTNTFFLWSIEKGRFFSIIMTRGPGGFQYPGADS